MKDYLNKTMKIAHLEVENDMLQKRIKQLEDGIKEGFLVKYLSKLEEPKRMYNLRETIRTLENTILVLTNQRKELRKDNRILRDKIKELKNHTTQDKV